jgi:hypothetical protein
MSKTYGRWVAAATCAIAVMGIVSAPAASANPQCGTLNKPAGCINPTPTDIANANQACADLRANPTDDGVKLVTNRLLPNYGRDSATALLRYATVTICPDMATAVAQEWNNRMRLIGSGPDWDSMWK